MSRSSRQQPLRIWVTEDPALGVALITGTGKVGSLLHAARIYDRATWSDQGHGFVIPIACVADLVAVCEWAGHPVRVRERKGEA